MPDEMPTTFTMSAPAEIAFVPALYEKRQVKNSKEPRWELALALAADHPDLAAFKSMAKRIAEFNQPGCTATATGWKYPWSAGDAFIQRQLDAGNTFDNSHLAGKVLVNAHSTKFEPKLSVLVPGRGVVDYWDAAARETVKDRFYAGAMVLCEFSFAYYGAPLGPGVTAYLNKVLATGEGKRRSGGRSGQETWGAYVGNAGAPAMAGADEY